MGTKEQLREQRRLYMREWRGRQREKHNAYMREYRQKRKLNGQSCDNVQDLSDDVWKQRTSTSSPSDSSCHETTSSPNHHVSLDQFNNGVVDNAQFTIEFVSDEVLPTRQPSVCEVTGSKEREWSDGSFQHSEITTNRGGILNSTPLTPQSVVIDGTRVLIKQELVDSENEYSPTENMCHLNSSSDSSMIRTAPTYYDQPRVVHNSGEATGRYFGLTNSYIAKKENMDDGLVESCSSYKNNDMSRPIIRATNKDFISDVPDDFRCEDSKNNEEEYVKEQQREKRRLYMKRYRERIGEQYNVYMREYRLKRGLTKRACSSNKSPTSSTPNNDRRRRKSVDKATNLQSSFTYETNSVLNSIAAEQSCEQRDVERTLDETTPRHFDNNVRSSETESKRLSHTMFMLNGETRVELDPRIEDFSGNYNIPLNKLSRRRSYNLKICPPKTKNVKRKIELDEKLSLKEKRRLYMKEYRKRLGDEYNAYMRQYRLKTGLTKLSYKELRSDPQSSSSPYFSISDLGGTSVTETVSEQTESNSATSTHCPIPCAEFSTSRGNSDVFNPVGDAHKQTTQTNKYTNKHSLHDGVAADMNSCKSRKKLVKSFASSANKSLGRTADMKTLETVQTRSDVSCRLREQRRLYMQSYRSRLRDKYNLYMREYRLRKGITKYSPPDSKSLLTGNPVTVKNESNPKTRKSSGTTAPCGKKTAKQKASSVSETSTYNGNDANNLDGYLSRETVVPLDKYIKKEESDFLVEKEEPCVVVKSENCQFADPSSIPPPDNTYMPEILPEPHTLTKEYQTREYRRNYMRNYRYRQREKYNAYMREYRQRRAPRLEISADGSVIEQNENLSDAYFTNTDISTRGDLSSCEENSYAENSDLLVHDVSTSGIERDESCKPVTTIGGVKVSTSGIEGDESCKQVTIIGGVKEDDCDLYSTDYSHLMQNMQRQKLCRAAENTEPQMQRITTKYKGNVQEYRRNYMRFYRNTQREKYNAYMREYRRKKAAVGSSHENSMQKSQINNGWSSSDMFWSSNNLDVSENKNCVGAAHDSETRRSIPSNASSVLPVQLWGSPMTAGASNFEQYATVKRNSSKTKGLKEYANSYILEQDTALCDGTDADRPSCKRKIGAQTICRTNGDERNCIREEMTDFQGSDMQEISDGQAATTENFALIEPRVDEETRKMQTREQRRLYMREYRARNKGQAPLCTKQYGRKTCKVGDETVSVYRHSHLPVSIETDDDNSCIDSDMFGNANYADSSDLKYIEYNVDIVDASDVVNNSNIDNSHTRTRIQENTSEYGDWVHPLNVDGERYYEDLREKRKLYMRQYRTKNRDKYNAYMREYRRLKDWSGSLFSSGQA